ncbi:MAG: hypothetical protein ACI4WS_05405 [Oscillospiraceae bacterium]
MSKRVKPGGNGLAVFGERAMMIAAAVASLLLQIISFFTTWQGAEAYFATAFPAAPLVFALAVQSVVYFSANSIRRKAGAGKIAALFMALCCSGYFSFVGIYSAVNPPGVYLQRTYSGYAAELQAAAEGLNSARNADSSADINSAVNAVISRSTEVESELAALERLTEQLSAVEGTAASGMTPPSRWNYATYEDYAAAYSAYAAGVSQGNSGEKQLKTAALLAEYGFGSSADLAQRVAELTAEQSLIEGTLGASGSGLYQRAEQLRASMLSGDRASAEKVFSLYQQISGEKLEFAADQPEITLDLPEYSAIEEEGETAPAAVRERLLGTISAACDLLNAAGGEASAEDYPLENIYTLPLTAAFKDFSADAVVSLLLALLVDWLSLAAAVIWAQRKPVLTAKTTAQAAASDERFFERNVAAALKLGAFPQSGELGGQWDEGELTERLAEYISRFGAADFAAEQGCTLLAARSDLRDNEPLTAFLCQCGYAKLLTAQELSLLSGGGFEADGVLLKTKFLLWFSELTERAGKAV